MTVTQEEPPIAKLEAEIRRLRMELDDAIEVLSMIEDQECSDPATFARAWLQIHAKHVPTNVG